MFSIDKPGASPIDKTEAIEDNLLFTPRNLPANMFCIEQPPANRRSKSHRGMDKTHGAGIVTKADGTQLLNMDGKPVAGHSHVPSQISSQAHPAYLEYLIHKTPSLTYKDIAARMQNATKIPSCNRLTNLRRDWRDGNNESGKNKCFLMRSSIE